MKRLMIIAALVCAGWNVNAQTEKGSWLVGASSALNFTTINPDVAGADDITNLQLNLKGGNFLIDNLAGGLNTVLSYQKSGDAKSTRTEIGPFLRYYINGGFYFGASYLFVNQKTTVSGNEFKSDATLLGLEAGYPIWIVPNVAVEPAFVYRKQNSDDLGDVSQLGLEVGFTLYF